MKMTMARPFKKPTMPVCGMSRTRTEIWQMPANIWMIPAWKGGDKRRLDGSYLKV